MYNSNQQGTLFRRKNGVWYGNYSRNGKQIKFSLKTKDKKIAQQRFQEILLHPSDRKVNFSSALEETLEDMYLRGLKGYDILLYHSKPVREILGEFKVSEVNEEVIRQFVRSQLSSGLKPSTINRRLHIIRQTLKTSRIKGIITYVPSVNLLSEAGNARQGYFTDEEIHRLLPYLQPYLRDFTLFGYLSGWRKSEIASLTWSDYNETSQTISLSQSKNNESRVLPLIGDLLTLIQKRQDERQGEYIFHQGNGKPVGRIHRNWRTACRKAGMPKTKIFHDLRRSAVRNMVQAGIPERQVMSLSGHRTNHMLHRYHIVSERDLREVLGRTSYPKTISSSLMKTNNLLSINDISSPRLGTSNPVTGANYLGGGFDSHTLPPGSFSIGYEDTTQSKNTLPGCAQQRICVILV